MSDLNQIRALEAEAIKLAEIRAGKQEILATISEMMTATRRYLGETNAYLDDINQE